MCHRERGQRRLDIFHPRTKLRQSVVHRQNKCPPKGGELGSRFFLTPWQSVCYLRTIDRHPAAAVTSLTLSQRCKRCNGHGPMPVAVALAKFRAEPMQKPGDVA